MWRMAARDRLGASLSAAAAVPALVWWAYVQAHTPPDGTPWLSSYPFSGIFLRTLQGTGNPISTPWLRAADVLENVALAGMWLAVLLALYLAIKWRGTFIEITAILFGAFAATMGKFDLWSSAYATGRTLSPLLILLALLAFRGRGELFAAPLLLIVPRIALQYEAQLKLILRGMR